MEKKMQEISEITAVFREHVLNLQNLANKAAQLGCRMAKMNVDLNTTSRPLDESDRRIYAAETGAEPPGVKAVAGNLPNVIKFPGKFLPKSHRTESSVQTAKQTVMPLFFAVPGAKLTEAIHDYRPELQRDGLILLAWDKRKTEIGSRFTAYWVTSTGIPRFYASKLLSREEFSSARPCRKSYAAEDGIDFYGQEAPVYMVHVAPELMKSNPRHGELRAVHIDMLRQAGSNVDFNYKYLLKNERNPKRPPKPPKRGESHSSHPVGA